MQAEKDTKKGSKKSFEKEVEKTKLEENMERLNSLLTYGKSKRDIMDEINALPDKSILALPRKGNYSILMHFCNNEKNEEIALAIIKTGYGNPSIVTDNMHYTALYEACGLFGTTAKVVKALVDTGDCNPNVVTIKGDNAIIRACANGERPDLAVVLLKHLKLDLSVLTPDTNKNALMHALSSENEEAALLIVEQGGFDLSVLDSTHNNALHYACMHNLDKVGEKIVEKGGFNLAELNNNNKTALLLACRENMQKTAIALLKTGKGLPEHIDDGKSAFYFACENAMYDVMNEFLDLPIYKMRIFSIPEHDILEIAHNNLRKLISIQTTKNFGPVKNSIVKLLKIYILHDNGNEYIKKIAKLMCSHPDLKDCIDADPVLQNRWKFCISEERKRKTQKRIHAQQQMIMKKQMELDKQFTSKFTIKSRASTGSRSLSKTSMSSRSTKKVKSADDKSSVNMLEMFAHNPITLQNILISDWLNLDPKDNVIFIFKHKYYCMKRSYFSFGTILPYSLLQECIKDQHGTIYPSTDYYLHLEKLGLRDTGILKIDFMSSIAYHHNNKFFHVLQTTETKEVISAMSIRETNIRSFLDKDLTTEKMHHTHYDMSNFRNFRNIDPHSSTTEDIGEFLTNYSKYWDRRVNNYLRSGKNENEYTEYLAVNQKLYRDFAQTPKDAMDQILQNIQNLDYIFIEFGEILPKPIAVYRGIDKDRDADPYLGLNQSYLSTTTNKEVAEDFAKGEYERGKDPDAAGTIYKCTITPGIPFISMMKYSKIVSEYEILLPRGLVTSLDSIDDSLPRRAYNVTIKPATKDQFKKLDYKCKKYPVVAIVPMKK